MNLDLNRNKIMWEMKKKHTLDLFVFFNVGEERFFLAQKADILLMQGLPVRS